MTSSECDQEQALALTKHWVERIVIGLNLCPFAARDWDQGRVRCTTCDAGDEEDVLLALAGETHPRNQELPIEPRRDPETG